MTETQKDTLVNIPSETCDICGPTSVYDTNTNNNDKILAEIQDSSPLIKPCLCNRIVHQSCLKAYIMFNRVIKCQKCFQNYLIKDKTNKKMKSLYYFWIFLAIVIVLFACGIDYLLAYLIWRYAGLLQVYENEGLNIAGPIAYMIFEGFLFLIVLIFIAGFPFWIRSMLNNYKLRAYDFDVLSWDLEKNSEETEGKMDMVINVKESEIQNLIEKSRRNDANEKKYAELYKRIKTMPTIGTFDDNV